MKQLWFGSREIQDMLIEAFREKARRQRISVDVPCKWSFRFDIDDDDTVNGVLISVKEGTKQ
ncbi:hypothetical protein [Achromobacter sp. 2789STDY5608633]|uniref:hypothetical protein n=1 Tax=Achromobacter sp. 2789STDY5608633 TaxID=1806501 RepID=UPI0012E0E552|nr:hypothetical protein [Achromobacter sp. 2789STDY5608633]